MDSKKLQALRARYEGAAGSDIDDPDFRKAAGAQFSDSDRRKWPFADPATFLGAPFLPDAAGSDFAGVDIALIGVPMDLGVTNRAGARLGPRAVRSVERIGPYEHVLRMTPSAEARIADIGDVPFRSRFSLESCHEDIEAFFAKVVAAGVIPLAVGGDHSISRAILRAIGRDHLGEERLDVLMAALQAETAAERHIADIGDAGLGAGRHAQHMLVRADALDRPYRPRPQPGTGTVGDAEVHRHADQRDAHPGEIAAGRVWQKRRAEKGRGIGKRPFAPVAVGELRSGRLAEIGIVDVAARRPFVAGAQGLQFLAVQGVGLRGYFTGSPLIEGLATALLSSCHLASTAL